MSELSIIFILLIPFGAFLYWAYLPDHRRNPKEFWRTIIGMPLGMILVGLGYPELNNRIKKWALGEETKKENKE